MDWHAWLSSARLEPAVAYEYALVLARNELEAGDVAYFDHELLRSMGISVAKHRLEILKLAGGRRAGASSSLSFPSASNALAAAGRYVRSLVRRSHRRHGESSAALVLVPTQPQPQPLPAMDVGRSKAPPKRTRSKGPAVTCRGAAVVHAESAAAGEEMVRWDRLFHDLNPN